jgi:hypothetical protein
MSVCRALLTEAGFTGFVTVILFIGLAVGYIVGRMRT